MDVQIREVNKEDFEAVFSLFMQLWPGKQLHKEDLFAIRNEAEIECLFW